MTMTALFYIGACLKDCLLLPLLFSKVLLKSVEELQGCRYTCACSHSFTDALYVFEVWKDQHAFISGIFLCFKVWFLCTSQEKLLNEMSQCGTSSAIDSVTVRSKSTGKMPND